MVPGERENMSYEYNNCQALFSHSKCTFKKCSSHNVTRIGMYYRKFYNSFTCQKEIKPQRSAPFSLWKHDKIVFWDLAEFVLLYLLA